MTATVEEARELTRADDRGKWDVMASPQDLFLEGGRLVSRTSFDGDRTSSLELGTWAAGQVCRRLGVPTPYFRRCPTELQDRQFNYWLHEAPKPKQSQPPEKDDWLLRCKGDTVRGVLSERYARLDNVDLMRSLEPALHSRFRVAWFALGEESFHLRLLDETLARDVRLGDRVVAGVHVANSEVGRRAVTIDALVYRLVCTNGLIRLVRGASLLNRRHVGVARPHFEATVRQAVNSALTGGVAFIDRLAASTTQVLEDVDLTIRRLTTRWSLSQTTVGHMRQSLLGEDPSQQETLYGLVNAVTNAAQRLPADDRYSLEALASTLLDRTALRPVPEDAEPEMVEGDAALLV